MEELEENSSASTFDSERESEIVKNQAVRCPFSRAASRHEPQKRSAMTLPIEDEALLLLLKPLFLENRDAGSSGTALPRDGEHSEEKLIECT